ncbi:MAG TPA: hypothetical protein VFH42_05150 [Sporolactobacillaceae bacterium]|nr:hypothetical protein [Sporolactobacillaceae bacterium]
MKDKRPTQLFGLHKASVDHFLKKLDQSYHDELLLLQDELSELTKKNAELERSILRLKADLSKPSASDVFAKATAGLPSMLNAIQAQVVKETDEIRLKAEQELHSLDQAIHKIKRDIQKGTRLFDTFIQQFSKGIEDLGQLPETLLADHPPQTETEAFLPQESRSFQEIDVTISVEEPHPEAVGFSSFWEGSERVLSQSVTGLVGVSGKTHSHTSFTTLKSLEDSTTEHHLPINQKRESIEPLTSGVTTTALPNEAMNQEPNSAGPSEGIKQEIDLIKRRYIVGKVAGSTLYDRSGNLIIEKGQPITDESVDHANRTGQLSDLIVHMRLPGLGE